ncbi:MAG: zinc ribbon domain-containing protein [Bdellovibrionota bacterium]|nr:MAG: zinc ribbon domain-containing protein [Bdellovibrionota bacterium]
MPIYEYECPKCGRFDALQKVSEKPLKAKPECSDPKCPRAAQRVMSPSAFHLKGSGWYKTDYTAPSSAAGSTKASGTASEGSTTSSDKDTKTDSGSKGSAGKPCGPKCGCH